MKKLFVTVALAGLACLCLCSCGANKTVELERRDLTGEVVFEDIFIGAPQQIMFHGDLLLLRDEYDDKALSVIDTKTGTITGRHLSIGRGPGEMVNPFRCYVHGDRLYAHQMRTGQVSVYSLPGVTYIESFEMEGAPGLSLRMADYYVGMRNDTKPGRLQIYDTTGKYLFPGGDWPAGDDNMPTAFNGIAHQGDHAVQPGGNRYAFAAAYSDRVEFHQIRRGEHVLVSATGSDDVLVDRNNSDNSGNLRLASNVYLGSAGMQGGNDYCWMHRIDGNQGSEGIRRNFSDLVRKYEWDGTPVAEYHLDRQIAGMTIDPAEETIYGMVLDDDGYVRIVRFPISL